MDSQQFLDRISPFIKQNFLVLASGLVGLIFFMYGLISLFSEANSSEEIIFKSESDTSIDKNAVKIKVDVQGEVLNPGVYSLSLDSRIQDALVAAGGMAEVADRVWVSKNLNLAQKLVDGSKIYIPKTGEGLGGGSGVENGLKGKININFADSKELESLPGVGPVTAQTIIDNRPYSSIEELISKKVIGEKVFGDIKEKITAY